MAILDIHCRRFADGIANGVKFQRIAALQVIWHGVIPSHCQRIADALPTIAQKLENTLPTVLPTVSGISWHIAFKHEIIVRNRQNRT